METEIPFQTFVEAESVWNVVLQCTLRVDLEKLSPDVMEFSPVVSCLQRSTASLASEGEYSCRLLQTEFR